MSRQSTLITLLLSIALTLLSSCMGEGKRMLGELERLEALNRSDTLFTSDSAAQRLVTYYDRWYRIPTNRNRQLRMRAYYMLGSAYRDMGEAPAALHYFDIATRQPDTTNVDSATAATLFRIYGQMATIYEQQNLPQEELASISRFSKYALIAKDTASYILGFAHMAIPYFILGDTTNVIRATNKAYKLYREHKLYEDAAQVFPVAIYVYLKNQNLSMARKYMDIFEYESGLFDEKGNIETGREQYYENKGLYYLYIDKRDSAEFYFRKLLYYGYAYEAYQGLLSLYQRYEQYDSIAKYALKLENATNTWLTQRQTEAIIQSSSMYRYERNQNLAEKKAMDAKISHYFIALLIVIAVIGCLLASLRFSHIKRIQLEKDVQFHRLVEEHLQIQIICQHQEEQIAVYRQDVVEKEEQLKEEDIVIYFHKMAQGKYNGQMPTKRDWEKLIRTYSRYMPHMYARMQVAKLTRREQITCILGQLDFSATDLTLLLDTSKQIVSNTRLSAKRKLFGLESNYSLVQSLKKCVYFEA